MNDLPLDECLTLVSDRCRRRAIERLRNEEGGAVTIAELVDELHGSESISVGDRRTDRDRIRVQLVHKHLPKLAEYGVVDYDEGRDTVRYRPDERIEAVLDSLPSDAAQLAP